MTEFEQNLELYLDGEVSDQALSDLLIQCEEEPELWRVCALKCIESGSSSH